MNRSIIFALLVAIVLFVPVPAVAAGTATLTATATDIWPNKLDSREPRSVAVTYSVPEAGTYALLVMDRYADPWMLEPLGTLQAGSVGTWTWDALDEHGVPVPRTSYIVRLMRDDGSWIDDPHFGGYMGATAAVTVKVHNSTERLVVDDFDDGQGVRVDQFALSNGPTRVAAEFVMAPHSKRPRFFFAGFDVRGVPGGYYVQAIHQRNGRFKTRVLYTRSLPGDGPATRLRCRGAKLQQSEDLYSLVVPRKCMKKAKPTSQIRAFFGAARGYAGNDQPEGQVQDYWTYWTQATKRGA